ncbi:MAG: hypothetical protein H0X46_05145 [Bacteroidetes bacterium]|nr:hypothetical protein [Bacteroidota bacterium]
MSKECLECGDSFKGRIDKKFCSDLCRNSFNNKLKTAATDYYRNVNSTLRKNYKILEELLPEQTAKASRAKLMQKGFNFNFFTNVYTTKKGTNYYYCYEYGYLPIDNDYFFLVKKKEEEVK